MAQPIGASEPFDGSVRGGRQSRRGRFVHDHPDEQFRSFPFRVGKIFRAIQSEQPGEVRVIPLRQELHAPAQRGGRETKRRERMPHVVLAIAEGPFAVFPRLAPGNGGQPHMEFGRVGFDALRPARPLFQGVMQWRVVIDTSTTWQAFEAGQDGVGLRRMQVAAGRVHPQIPARIGNLLARGKTQGQFKEQAHPFERERSRTLLLAAPNKAAAGGVSSGPVNGSRNAVRR